MAEILRFCDPNAEAGGDGTTNGLTGATCAYVSLNAWEAATQQDLTDGGGDTARVVCSSDDAGSTHLADTTACVIDGWTTDATRYIQIEAASSHGGKWNSSIYRLEVSGATALGVGEDYVRCTGLQIKTTLTAANQHCIYAVSQTATTNALWFSKIICDQGNSASYYAAGIYLNSTNINAYIWNTIVQNYGATSNSNANGLKLNVATVSIYSSIITGRRNGVNVVAGTAVAKNVYAYAPTTTWNGTITKTTCADTATVPYDTTTFVNVTADSQDYHLVLGSGLIDVGTDTSGDAAPLNFTDDIDGVARTGTWDIGADEYVSVTAIKTILGLAKASVKTVDGLAIASVKTWDGLA